MGKVSDFFKDGVSSLFRSRKNLINILLLGILILALPLGINLIRQQQILKSRANADPIVFTANAVQRNGQWVVLDRTKPISFELTSPLGGPPGSPNPSPVLSPSPTITPTPAVTPTPVVSPTPTPSPTWSNNLLDSGFQNGSYEQGPSGAGSPNFGPGTYTLTGEIPSNEPVVGDKNGATAANIQADEWTSGGTYAAYHPYNAGAFTVPAGNYIVVIERVINARATFRNVSLTKEQEGQNLIDPTYVNYTATQTRGVARATPTSLSQKYRLYGDSPSGDGYFDVAEWTSANQWLKSNRVGDPAFGVSTLGNFLQVGYVVNSGSVRFSNVRFVEVTQSPNQLGANLQNASFENGPGGAGSQQWFFGPGTYKLTGEISSNVPVVGGGNATAVGIQADEWNDAQTTYVAYHPNNTTFTVPAGNKIIVLERVINARATFSNVSLQKQQ